MSPVTDPTTLLLLGAASIALLLTLILKLKLHPFVALLLVSIATALAAGIKPSDLVTVIEDGAGRTLGHIALIIPLGAMIGRMIQLSGGAESLATDLVQRFGSARAPLALTIAGFLIGIPVFFEVGVVMLMPIAYGVARTTGRPLLVFALPMCIALLIVHAFLPPHPGAVAAASLLNVEIGRMLLWGLPICAATTVVAWFIARQLTQRVANHSATAVSDLEAADAGTINLPAAPPPGVATIICLVLFPIVLIMLGVVATAFLPTESAASKVLTVLSVPFVALLLDVLLCAWLLGVRRGWSRAQVANVIGSAIPGIAIVILITGAGGIFARVLVTTGIGNAIATLLQSSGLPILGLAFLITLLLRAAQGPTTVAIITTAGILNPLIAQAGFSANQMALICLAMGAGGLAMSHINDPGFWIVTRLTGLDVATGLRTWTFITTCAGIVGFALLVLLWFQV